MDKFGILRSWLTNELAVPVLTRRLRRFHRRRAPSIRISNAPFARRADAACGCTR
jgi:hypothetical protein